MAGLESRRSSYLEEDIHHLVSHSRYPRLQNCHELAEDIISNHTKKKRQTQVLQQCLVLQLERHVLEAQQRGLVPHAQELAKLPLFDEARNMDISFLKKKYETTCQKEREEERRRLEEERLEAERKLEREEQRKRKREMKELRRKERMEEKKEQVFALHEKKKRQFEDAWEKWQQNVKEQQAVLDALQEKIRSLDEKRKASVDVVDQIDKEKERLLQSLREAAAKTDAAGSLPKKEDSAQNSVRFRHEGKSSHDDKNGRSSNSHREYRSHPPPPPRRRDDSPRGYHGGPRVEHSSIRRGPPPSARYDRGSGQKFDPRPKHYKSYTEHSDRYHGRHDRPYKRQQY